MRFEKLVCVTPNMIDRGIDTDTFSGPAKSPSQFLANRHSYVVQVTSYGDTLCQL